MSDKSIKGRSKILRTGGVEPFEITLPIGPKGGGGKIAGKQFQKDTGLHKGSKRKATSPKAMGTQRPKTKSDFSLKHQVKQIQKSPDKKFKHQNPATEKVKSLRTGREFEVRKKDLVKGSLGKKTYIQDTKYYHYRNQPKGKK